MRLHPPQPEPLFRPRRGPRRSRRNRSDQSGQPVTSAGIGCLPAMAASGHPSDPSQRPPPGASATPGMPAQQTRLQSARLPRRARGTIQVVAGVASFGGHRDHDIGGSGCPVGQIDPPSPPATPPAEYAGTAPRTRRMTRWFACAGPANRRPSRSPALEALVSGRRRPLTPPRCGAACAVVPARLPPAADTVEVASDQIAQCPGTFLFVQSADLGDASGTGHGQNEPRKPQSRLLWSGSTVCVSRRWGSLGWPGRHRARVALRRRPCWWRARHLCVGARAPAA